MPAAAGDRWCCYGCELAARIQAEAREEHGRLFGTLSFAALLSMSVMMLALFLYAEDVFDAGADREMAWMREGYRVASLVLSIPVMALAGLPLARRALERLRSGRLSMEALIALGAFTAFGVSAWAVMTGGSRVYFDSAATAVVLATLGRYLEATARSRASQVLGPSLEGSRAEVTIVEAGGDKRCVAPSEIAPGMLLEVEAEGVVPADLRLEGGPAEVSLGVLTGESRPVTIRAGDTVPAGAVPVSSAIRGVALRAARDSTLERLAALARSLKERPSRLIRWADGFAAALTPLVALIAFGTFAFWSSRAGLEVGVVNALAVVLVACPCSYAIATPLVHWLAMRRALSAGVLMRSAETLDALAGIERVAFDKTGTLTASELGVSEVALAPGAAEAEVRAVVAALEAESRHPVGRALAAWAGDVPRAALASRRIHPGSGVSGTDGAGRAVVLGRDPAGNDVTLTRSGVPLARFTVSESLRPEAKEALAELAALGVSAEILTGDRGPRAEKVARALGIPARAGLAPEDKIAALGERSAMVGDGLNDAPALAGVATSFAMEGATDLARGLSQVSLLRPDLRLVPWSIALARRSLSTSRWLIGLSTGYNLVFVTLAVTGLLRPVWAGLSMLVASLLTLAFAAGSGGLSQEEEEVPC